MTIFDDILKPEAVAEHLAASKRCVLAVSGGADSMALLHWFSKHLDAFAPEISVRHINHNIHPDSAQWADFVATMCQKWQMPCIVDSVQVSTEKNLENAARKARYQSLCTSGADTITMAHHGNDQVENFLLRVFRGSGVRGLKSMPVSAPCWMDPNINLVRPLLGITRSQILEYNSYYNIPYVDDPSNADTDYDRNWIRNRVWPVISERFDIADINTMRTIQHMNEAWQLVSQLADMDWESSLTLDSSDGELDWTAMKSLGYLRLKNLLLRILDHYAIYGFSINHVENFARGLLNANINSKNELSMRGFRMYKTGNTVRIDICS